MTITPEDREKTKDKMGPFGAQDDLTADLPNVLQNMLHEFANRNGIPSDITISEYRARKICDHREIGSYTLDIDSRLTSELSDYPFEVKYEDDLDIDKLEEIVEDKGSSLPIVKLSTGYFEHCVGYRAQKDSNGNTRDIYVLVMDINHQSVLVYDPYRYRRSENQKMQPTELPKRDFIKSWLGQWQITNTLWIEETEQSRLGQY